MTVGALPGDFADLRLIELDPVTGRGTEVRNLVGGFNVRGLAFSPAHGLITVDGDSLFTRYDPATGERQVLGVPADYRSIQALEFSPAGQLFGYSVRDRGLFVIDPTTLAVTGIGPTAAQDYRNIQSIAFAPDGRLFGVGEGDAFPYSDFLAVIHPITGARTLVTSDLQGIDNIRGIAIVPEPSAVLPLAGAGLLTLRRRRNAGARDTGAENRDAGRRTIRAG